MRIREVALLDFMGEPGTRFVIPRYQRAYSWEDEQCDELWRDLFRAARDRRSHFAGALIYHDEQDGAEVARAIVDGQQRLTTVTLILTALAAHLRENGETIFGMDASVIEETYLQENGAAKLRLSRGDWETLDALVTRQPIPDKPSKRLMDNHSRFTEKMDGEDFDPLKLWAGLSGLTVIAAELDGREQAPEVFESFNSKGAPLVTADLVRNHLLLAESRSEQARLYERYWEPIQGVFGDDPGSLRLNGAILGWLSVRFRQVRKFGAGQAFSIFKSFCEDEYDGPVDNLLEELYAFCLVWAENYRYHAVKKYKTADWARLGRKTRVSGRPLAELDNPENRAYYQKHFGVDPKW